MPVSDPVHGKKSEQEFCDAHTYVCAAGVAPKQTVVGGAVLGATGRSSIGFIVKDAFRALEAI